MLDVTSTLWVPQDRSFSVRLTVFEDRLEMLDATSMMRPLALHRLAVDVGHAVAGSVPVAGRDALAVRAKIRQEVVAIHQDVQSVLVGEGNGRLHERLALALRLGDHAARGLDDIEPRNVRAYVMAFWPWSSTVTRSSGTGAKTPDSLLFDFVNFQSEGDRRLFSCAASPFSTRVDSSSVPLVSSAISSAVIFALALAPYTW